MFKFFTKNREEVDEAAESSVEDDEPDKFLDVFCKPLAIQNWKDDIIVSYHFLSVRDIAPHLSTWCFNRKLDEKHKDMIKIDLLQNENPHLMGTIQIVRDKKLNCRVINGQHRLFAIQEILREDIDMTFQMSLMFEVYECNIDDVDDVSNLDMFATIQSMFKIANNSLNMKPEQNHDIYCKQIVIAMMNDPILKRGIVDKTNGEVYKPRITAKTLYELLHSFLNSDKMSLDVPQVVLKIKQINAQISTTPFIVLFGRHSPAQSKMRQFEKAKELGFYLNMNCKMSPTEWIEELSK